MSAHVKTSFDRAAAGYHEHARVQAALVDWVAEWLPAVRTGRVLEIGAGPGLFTQKISDWPGGATATDISPAMCGVGRVAVPQADWHVMAAEKPRAGPWNWIFSSGMLQWARNPGQIFSAWRAQLAPGGRVLAGLFVAESLPELREVSGVSGPVAWRPPQEWRASLAKAGLKILRDDSEQRVFDYGSAREFFRTLHGVGAAPQRRFAPGRMRQMMRDYETRFGGAGGVRATWTFYRFEAGR